MNIKTILEDHDCYSQQLEIELFRNMEDWQREAIRYEIKKERERIINLIEKPIQEDRYAGAPNLGNNIISKIKEL